MIAADGWVVLVTVSAVHGSAPREAGTKMLVGPETTKGTIGGGTLEFKAIQQARNVAKSEAGHVREFDYPLGPKTQQCCGGRVELLVERLDTSHLDMLVRIDHARTGSKLITSLDSESPVKKVVNEPTGNVVKTDSHLTEPLSDTRTRLFLFGAGHVGQAIVARMDNLPFRITWIDSRADQFPADMPDNVEISVSPSSTDMVAKAPPDSAFLVMTHSHRIDFSITSAILARGDARYCGLIGSKTKRVKFLKRFVKEEGLSDTQCKDLICPIGLPTLSGKAPEIVAIGVIAQLLELFD